MEASTSGRVPDYTIIGTDTFRGLGSSTLLRTTLYSKNEGTTSTDRIGLTRTESPISGNLLVSTSSNQKKVRDPISGTTLNFKGSHAHVTTPAQKNVLQRSPHFYLTKDVDITIQTLRSTTKVNRFTNEKVGTAGTPTGMDNTLRTFKEAAKQQ